VAGRDALSDWGLDRTCHQPAVKNRCRHLQGIRFPARSQPVLVAEPTIIDIMAVARTARPTPAPPPPKSDPRAMPRGLPGSDFRRSGGGNKSASKSISTITGAARAKNPMNLFGPSGIYIV